MKILDFGYLELVEHWGSDQAVIEAARMSTDKGFMGWGPTHLESCAGFGLGVKIPDINKCDCTPKTGDEKLLRYLWEHEHATPFEMAGMTIEVKAPIMVFREWHRHRVPFGYNEMSARYVTLPDENYVPDATLVLERARAAQMSKNKQAQGHVAYDLTMPDVESWLSQLEEVYRDAQAVYEIGLRLGVPKELARLCVPVGRYSRMRATGNLRGWLAFCKLRMAPTAQWEIRQYANAVGQILGEKFPRTWALFEEGQKK